MAKYACPSCGISLNSIKKYVDHQLLHRHEANSNFPCCFSDCKQKFMKYTALKAHVYRSHNSPVPQLDDINRSFVCEHGSCRKQCIDLRDLIAHLKVHLSKHEVTHCPFSNCNKVFKVRSSFTSHISRAHNQETDVTTRVRYSESSVSSEIEHNETVRDQNENQSQGSEDSDIRSLYLRNLCLFYMQLQAKYLVPSSTIQMIVEEINGLSDICHQYTKDNVEEMLRENTNMSDAEIDSVSQSLQETNLHAACSSHLSTEHIRRQFYEKNFSYVHPENVYLGTNEHRKDCFAQYIPLQGTLNAILKDSGVWEQCINSQTRPVSDIISDICDGSVFKSNELFQQAGNLVLKLILYQDSFEVVNPLGSARKKHKLVGVYFTLADFEPFQRSNINNMQLVLLCKETDFKYFGQDAVFSKMLSDLRHLEEHGLLTASGQVVQATILSIVGDNLGSHCIGGYTQNFSTSIYFCRFCEIQRGQLESVSQSFPARTIDTYRQAIQSLQESHVDNDVKGIYRDSVFNTLRYFHVCQPGLPPCIGHDLFEGVVAYDLAIYLRYFIKVKHWLTYTQLNRRLKQFAYKGSDSSSSPCQVSEKSNTVGGQAAENWCLLRLLPVIIGDKVDPQDPVWQLLITLKELVELVCAPKITTAQVAYLNIVVIEYLETRKLLFPSDHLKPKHHYLLHYASLILKLGPLIRLWTMRFESKHSYFKRCVRRIQNFKNVCQSLANQHQLLQATLISNSFFGPVLKSKNSTPYHAHLYSQAVCNAVEAHTCTDPDSVSTEVEYKGTLYKKGSFLCLKRESDGSIKFGQLELVLMKGDKKVGFLVTPYTSLYLSEYGLYEVEQAAETMHCINAEDCLDFYPLPLYSLNGHSVISLKHSVVDQ